MLVSALAVLALSSLSKSRRFVAIMYAGDHLLHAGDEHGAGADHRQPVVGAAFRRVNTLDVIADAVFRLTTPPRGRRWRRRLP